MVQGLVAIVLGDDGQGSSVLGAGCMTYPPIPDGWQHKLWIAYLQYKADRCDARHECYAVFYREWASELDDETTSV